RKDEDSLRAALLGAQRFGDNIVKEAKVKADAILKEANLKAEFTKADLEKQIENSKLELSQMKNEVSAFRGRMLSSYKTHIEMISSLPNVQEEVIKVCEQQFDEEEVQTEE
ncbi:MAG: DivIVA domain-containing protein, partial [Oscillospiraceae bacterium]